jgi:sugar phosphate isomerase/epimerase
MQIGIRLHDTYSLPLKERLEALRDQEFSCAHVALSKVIPDLPDGQGALTPGLAMNLRRLFHSFDIDIAVLGCYLNIANPDPIQLKDILDTYLAHIRFASILGCGVIGTETGAPNIHYQHEPACYSNDALLSFTRNLSKIVEYAEHMGVIIAIEPVHSHIVYNAKRARQVLDDIQSPNLQIIFDPVNLLNIDNYKKQAQIIDDAINLLGDEIAVIHMKDFMIQENKLISVAAGAGELKYQSIIEFIKKSKPMIHCTLEDTKPENAVIAKNYIQSLWEEY